MGILSIGGWTFAQPLCSLATCPATGSCSRRRSLIWKGCRSRARDLFQCRPGPWLNSPSVLRQPEKRPPQGRDPCPSPPPPPPRAARHDPRLRWDPPPPRRLRRLLRALRPLRLAAHFPPGLRRDGTRCFARRRPLDPRRLRLPCRGRHPRRPWRCLPSWSLPPDRPPWMTSGSARRPASGVRIWWRRVSQWCLGSATSTPA